MLVVVVILHGWFLLPHSVNDSLLKRVAPSVSLVVSLNAGFTISTSES